MFDYIFAQQAMPSLQCPNCNNKLYFHGNWYPFDIVCQNCGQVINLRQALEKVTYPKRKYDKDGMLIKED